MTIYLVTFQTYGTNEFQVSYNVFSKRKDAEQEAKELRLNGHTKVTVVKREVRFYTLWRVSENWDETPKGVRVKPHRSKQVT